MKLQTRQTNFWWFCYFYAINNQWLRKVVGVVKNTLAQIQLSIDNEASYNMIAHFSTFTSDYFNDF